MRAAAAMFVVFHHVWLNVWPAFPRNAGPWWVSPLLYGHLAVAVFIVVSGFSLALAPMRRGETLNGGTRRFLSRRAWRIVPPYWAALVLSTLITALILQPSLGASAVARGFFVHGLLVQDIVPSIAPNGAFWSIAVEWQIYFLFPLILLLGRWTSVRTSVLCTVALVIVAELIAGFGSPLNKIHHVSPQFLALFALGVLAVKVGQNGLGRKARRLLALAGAAALVGFVVTANVEGSVWVVNQYFWVDLVFGAAVACLMAAMFGGGLPRVRRALSTRVALTLGLFSYSIYLLHGPLVTVLYTKVFGPLHLAAVPTFGLLLVVGVPVILTICYGFHLMFEAPFLHRRDFGALREIPIVGRLIPNRVGVRVYASAAAPSEAAVAAPDVT
jgi:peptidoglycan/LPS O-acetylase OafA/YrhL